MLMLILFFSFLDVLLGENLHNRTKEDGQFKDLFSKILKEQNAAGQLSILRNLSSSCYYTPQQLIDIDKVLAKLALSIYSPLDASTFLHYANSILCATESAFSQAFKEPPSVWQSILTVLGRTVITDPQLVLYNNNLTVFWVHFASNTSSTFFMKGQNVTVSVIEGGVVNVVVLSNTRLFGGADSGVGVVGVFYQDQRRANLEVVMSVESPGHHQNCAIWSQDEHRHENWHVKGTVKSSWGTIKDEKDRLVCEFSEAGLYSYRHLRACYNDDYLSLKWPKTLETHFCSKFCISDSFDPFMRRLCTYEGWVNSNETKCLDMTADPLIIFKLLAKSIKLATVSGHDIVELLALVPTPFNITATLLEHLSVLLSHLSDAIASEHEVDVWLKFGSIVFNNYSSETREIMQRGLEKVVNNLVVTNGHYDFNSPGLSVAVHELNGQTHTSSYFVSNSRLDLDYGSDVKFGDGTILQLTAYTPSGVLAGPVEQVNVVIRGRNISSNSTVATITFSNTKGYNKCMYWDNVHSNWSDNGVYTVIEGDKVICHTTHFTSFAILLVPGSDDAILDVITIGSLTTSICFLVVSNLAMLLRRDTRRRTTQQLHVGLCTNMILMNFSFLLGHDLTNNKVVCKGAAGVILYFTLSSVFWMGAEGFALYEAVIRVYDNRITHDFLLITIALTTVISGAIVGASFAVKGEIYEYEKFCWLTTKGTATFFVPSLVLILAFNTVIMVLVLRAQTKSQRHRSCNPSDNLAVCCTTDIKQLKRRAKAIFSLSMLFGLTWLFGILGFFIETKILSYAFSISTSLQGFFFFVFFIFAKEDVRKFWSARVRQTIHLHSRATKRDNAKGDNISLDGSERVIQESENNNRFN